MVALMGFLVLYSHTTLVYAYVRSLENGIRMYRLHAWGNWRNLKSNSNACGLGRAGPGRCAELVAIQTLRRNRRSVCNVRISSCWRRARGVRQRCEMCCVQQHRSSETMCWVRGWQRLLCECPDPHAMQLSDFVAHIYLCGCSRACGGRVALRISWHYTYIGQVAWVFSNANYFLAVPRTDQPCTMHHTFHACSYTPTVRRITQRPTTSTCSLSRARRRRMRGRSQLPTGGLCECEICTMHDTRSTTCMVLLHVHPRLFTMYPHTSGACHQWSLQQSIAENSFRFQFHGFTFS